MKISLLCSNSQQKHSCVTDLILGLTCFPCLHIYFTNTHRIQYNKIYEHQPDRIRTLSWKYNSLIILQFLLIKFSEILLSQEGMSELGLYNLLQRKPSEPLNDIHYSSQSIIQFYSTRNLFWGTKGSMSYVFSANTTTLESKESH